MCHKQIKSILSYSLSQLNVLTFSLYHLKAQCTLLRYCRNKKKLLGMLVRVDNSMNECNPRRKHVELCGSAHLQSQRVCNVLKHTWIKRLDLLISSHSSMQRLSNYAFIWFSCVGAEKHLKIVGFAVLKAATDLRPGGSTFQQDNAPKHTAKATMEWWHHLNYLCKEEWGKKFSPIDVQNWHTAKELQQKGG